MRERIAGLGRRQQDRLTTLASHPNVRNPRAIGTVTAMELSEGEGDYLSSRGPALLAFFRERDLLLRPLGNTVYVMPPYCIDDGDLDAIYTAIAAAADALPG